MTYEEAIYVVKNKIHNDYTEIIVEALKKQVPVRPLIKHYMYGETMQCSVCLEHVRLQRFCGNCGQALDWSKE